MDSYIVVKAVAIFLCITAGQSQEPSVSPVFRIVGGSVADYGQFPYIASVQVENEHICGGAIIDKRWIVTAAHCFSLDPEYYETLEILVGTNRLSKGGHRYQGIEHFCHEKYNEEVKANDICLIKLDRDIKFDSVTKPIEINDNYFYPGDIHTLSGWGDTEINGTSVDFLNFANLRTIAHDECARMFKQYVSITLYCTFNGPNLGTCNGDSGGPLEFKGKLAGLSIWGVDCATGYPDTFTDVSLYKHWIWDTIEKNS